MITGPEHEYIYLKGIVDKINGETYFEKARNMKKKGKRQGTVLVSNKK